MADCDAGAAVRQTKHRLGQTFPLRITVQRRGGKVDGGSFPPGIL
jgi:hypothetical protein